MGEDLRLSAMKTLDLRKRIHKVERKVLETEDDELEELAFAAARASWAEVEGLSEAARARLHLAVRLNSLGFYTNSEQLCHHGEFSALTGSGIFALASGFNHSCDPSICRYSIGDVTVFVTNRPVAASEELCISYIEAELLCAPTSLRQQSLRRDFACSCCQCASVGTGGNDGVRDRATSDEALRGYRYLRVDEQVQAQLSLLPPAHRAEAAAAALRGEIGCGSEEEVEEDEEGVNTGKTNDVKVLLGKDAQELRVVQATALMQFGRHQEALAVWRRLAAFACHHCPPFDESITVYAVQAALCALVDGTKEEAASYVHRALVTHRSSCGVDMFVHRYRREIELSMATEDAKERFWAMVRGVKVGAMERRAEAVASWRFQPEDTPERYTCL